MQLGPEDAARLADELLDLGAESGEPGDGRMSASGSSVSGSSPDSGLVGVPGEGPSLPLGRLGNYRLTRLLGRGGMGEVYEAEQEHPRRRVALKIVRPQLMSPELRRRFDHEVRILGGLQHPGIAQIYEAGQFNPPSAVGLGAMDAQPTPFFAMEYVEGEPLTKFATERNLSLSDRLQLFVRVCQAVEHAHQRGVIHRDLKPANILVSAPAAATGDPRTGTTLADGLGQPKVLDFGVARATNADISVTTVYTEVGKLVGTLPYMSPEQASGDPDEVDTRSDIYALGVVLYELLSGKLPYEVRGDAAARVAESLRTIKEVDPTPLSSIDRVFRGDIETIVSKALEKERGRRYQSVGELAADVKRFLNHEPIVARRASRWYEVKKFARRNRSLVTMASVGAFVLVTGATVSTVLAVVAMKERETARAAEAAEHAQRQIATQKQKEAEREAAISRAVVKYVREALTSPDPWRGRRDISMVDAMKRAAELLEPSLKDQPEVELEVRQTLARTFWSLGSLEQTEAQAKRYLDLSVQVYGAEHPNTIGAMADYSAVIRQRGRLDEAEPLAMRALEMAEKTEGIDAAAMLACLSAVAHVHCERNRSKEGEAVALRAIELSKGSKTLQEAGEELSLTTLVAGARRDYGDFKGALAMYEEGIARSTAMYGPDHLRTLAFEMNKGATLQDLGRPHEAEPLLRKVYDARSRLLGEKHPDTLVTLNNLAGLLLGTEQLEEAEPLLRRAVEQTREALGDHQDTMIALGNMAALCRRLEKFEEGLRYDQESVSICEKVFGPEHMDTLFSKASLARSLISVNRKADARGLLEQTYLTARRVLPEDDWFSACLQIEYGMSLYGAWDEEGSKKHLEEGSRRLVVALGPTHPRTLHMVRASAATLEQMGEEDIAGEMRALLRPAPEGGRQQMPLD